MLWQESVIGERIPADRLRRVQVLAKLSKHGFGTEQISDEINVTNGNPIRPGVSICMVFKKKNNSANKDDRQLWFGEVRKMYNHVTATKKINYSLPVYFNKEGLLSCSSLHLVCRWYVTL